MHFTICTETPSELSQRRLVYVNHELCILEASRLMRNAGAAALLVTDGAQGATLPIGVVTARDIVTRVVAAGLDPAVLTAGDISWSDDSVDPKPAPSAADKLQLQESENGNMFAVLDSAGGVAGMLTLDEMVRALARKAPVAT